MRADDHPSTPGRPGGTSGGSEPWTVRAAAALAVVQAAGCALFAVRFVVDVLPLEEPRLERAGFAVGVVAFVMVGAVVIALAARALLRLRLWARSLLVVAQILALAIGGPMAQGRDWVGWLVIAMGAAGLVLLLHPATTAALDRADRGR